MPAITVESCIMNPSILFCKNILSSGVFTWNIIFLEGIVILFLITLSIHLFIKRKIIINTGLLLNNKIDIKHRMAPIIKRLGSNAPDFFIPMLEIMLEVNKEKHNSPAFMIQKIVATIVVISKAYKAEKFLTEIK